MNAPGSAGRNYGSEGWGFESLRARHVEHTPSRRSGALSAMDGAFVVPASGDV